eukprot:852556_1
MDEYYENKQWIKFYRIYKEMDKRIKKATENLQKIHIDAHDPDIDEVIFTPKNVKADRGSRYDRDFLNEEWDVEIHLNGKNMTYTDGKIVLDFKNKRVKLQYNSDMVKVFEKKQFSIGKKEYKVFIRSELST